MSTGEFFSIEPQELQFPFELKKQILCSLQLVNKSDNYVAFKDAVLGNRTIRIKDLERVAVAQDFTWTDTELAYMIHCFDSDGDEKLNLDDFCKIVGRCNMTQGIVQSNEPHLLFGS